MAPAGRETTPDYGFRSSAPAAHAGQHGLYDSSFEHDACGVAFIADLTGKPGHDVVSKALTALCNLEHRGAQGGDPGTGDGAGILTQIPDAFFREVCGFDLPPAGSYAAERQRRRARRTPERSESHRRAERQDLRGAAQSACKRAEARA